MFLLRALAAGSLILGVATSANATIYYNNMNNPSGSVDPTSVDGPQANSFSADGAGDVEIVTLELDSGYTTPNPNGLVEVDLYQRQWHFWQP